MGHNEMPDTPVQAKDYPRPTIFFDGGCPLCRREIAHYRNLDKNKNLTWVDITRETKRVNRLGLDQDRLMERFHVMDAHGRLLTGAWGFAMTKNTRS